MSLPTHIAIIPDGNRRWAKAKGLPSFAGHEAGAKALEKILETSLEKKITHVTVWLASINNITKRGATEVSFLFKLFTSYFKRLAKHKIIREHGIRVRVLGRWDKLCPPELKNAIQKLISATAKFSNHHLTFLLGYNGTTEMDDAIQALAKRAASDPAFQPTEAAIKQFLYTKDLPAVDLVIRTGGDPHLSTGFMMWDTAEAQLHFTPSPLPAFTPEEFLEILNHYETIERRHGK